MKDSAGLSVCGDEAAPLADAGLTFLQEIKYLLALQLEWHSLWILRLTLAPTPPLLISILMKPSPCCLHEFLNFLLMQKRF